MIPFAVVGSERSVIIDGKTVRGRKTRWGVINVEDEKHCEFVYLRNFLTRLVFPSTTWDNSLSCTRNAGHTCKILSRRPPRFTTRRSVQNNCLLSRNKQTRAQPPTRRNWSVLAIAKVFPPPCLHPADTPTHCAWIRILDMDNSRVDSVISLVSLAIYPCSSLLVVSSVDR